MKGRDNAIIRSTTNDGYSPFVSIKTVDGSWEVGPWNTGNAVNKLYFSYVTDTNYNANNNEAPVQITFLPNGHIVATLDGNASTASSANALSGFKISSTTNLGVDSTDVNQKIGYINGLTKANWNYQQTDGALYQQTYNASWIHQIFGDYRTGQISVRGRNNGTWESWRRVLDDSNCTSYRAGYVTVNGLTRDTWYNVTANNGNTIMSNSNIQIQDQIDQTGTRATYLKLGNGTATGTSGNKRGILRLYSPNAYFVDFFIDGTHLKANRYYMLPKIDANTLIVGTTDAKGGASVPVYVDANGALQQCTQNKSGAWHSNGVAYQAGAVLEIGRYIDFHCTAASKNDYDVRLDSGASRNSLTVSYPAGASTGAIIRNIQVSTTDLTAGSSELSTGIVYLVYQ